MSPGTTKALAVLRSTPGGVSVKQLAQLIHRSGNYTRQCLLELRDAGICGPVSLGGPATKWTTVENLPALRAALAEARRKRKNETTAAYKKRRREKANARREERIEEEHAQFIRIRQRIVSASDCEPVKVRAPISVFHLAEAA